MSPRKLLNQLANRFGYSIHRHRSIPITVAGKPSVSAPPGNDGEPVQVHMFWAYGEFSTLERLAAVSFVANGFPLKLWSYGEIGNVPRGVEICDAREVLPESRVFTYRNGSYAAFANLFRYSVLSLQGGLWADTDVICLVPVSALQALGGKGFLVTERTQDGALKINNNLIHHPAPEPGDIIDLARAIADRYPVDKLIWGDTGPKLLTVLAESYPKLAPLILNPEFANPVDWWECPQRLIDSAGEVPEGAWFLHGFNELWRRSGADKNAPYPTGSMLGQVFARYENWL